MNKYNWIKQSRQENLVYLIIWGLLFASPVISMYVRTINDAAIFFNWEEVFFVWKRFSLFLILFLIHNFLLLPILVVGHKRVTYFCIVALVVSLFAIHQCSSSPTPPDRHPKPELGMQHHPGPPPGEFRPDAPPPFIGEQDILALLVLILMFGANIGIKGYFRSRDDQRRLAELEKKNLEQQLEYLRYQINPHFFMNTLNNIHALIDIDPAKAQETVVELSKMMRFVLYEGDRQLVPLTKEMNFIRTYIQLMRLRYTDSVSISLQMPDTVPDRFVPPLVLVSFIENAFKHGISYQQPSFVNVDIDVEGEWLHFKCSNSKPNVNNQKTGGVGLANVRRRLDLLYPQGYNLQISDSTDAYTAELRIPFRQIL